MTDIIKATVQRLAGEYYQQVVSYREHLHQYPELSFEEKETAAFICSVLDKIGISYTTGWAGYGIVATIKGGSRGDCIALRADIDALPIQEQNTATYASRHPGKMHACGHDVHTSSLLGVAHILQEMREDIVGTVQLIWQPGEEKLPGGASIMIAEGALRDPVPRYILGQHVHPPLQVGKVGLRSGPYMASADEIYITVHGKGGHAALPQNCIDPIIIMSHILIALQDVVSRKAPPTSPSVLSFGKIWSHGGATNVIPEAVSVEGTFRAMNEEWRTAAHEHIKLIATLTAQAHGATCDVDVRVGYPYLNNHVELSTQVRELMVDYLGTGQVVDLPVRMTAEDFSYYSQVADACFYRLGTGNLEKGIMSPVHTPTFDIDSDALQVGMGTMAYIAVYLLRQLSSSAV